MKKLAQHEAKLAMAALLILLYLAAYVIIIRPRAATVATLRNQVSSQKNQLTQDGWPLDYSRLEALLGEKTRRRDAAQRYRQQIFERSTSVFQSRILRLFETQAHFEQQVTRLDYQEEFHRIRQKFAARDITFAEPVLHLSEDSTSAETYRLVLQLWALEAVLDQTLACNLVPVFIPVAGNAIFPGENGAELNLPRASAVMVQPPVNYHLGDKSSEPYLIDFPVRLRIRGAAADLQNFLRQAGNNQSFLAVKHFELWQPPPAAQNPNGATEANLECSAFYLLKGNINTRTLQTPGTKPMPKGA